MTIKQLTCRDETFDLERMARWWSRWNSLKQDTGAIRSSDWGLVGEWAKLRRQTWVMLSRRAVKQSFGKFRGVLNIMSRHKFGSREELFKKLDRFLRQLLKVVSPLTARIRDSWSFTSLSWCRTVTSRKERFCWVVLTGGFRFRVHASAREFNGSALRSNAPLARRSSCGY